jgi:hypothetical protein
MHATVKSLVSQGVLTACSNVPRPFRVAAHALVTHPSRPRPCPAISHAVDDDLECFAHSYCVTQGAMARMPMQQLRFITQGYLNRKSNFGG